MAQSDITCDVRIGGIAIAFSILSKTDFRQTFTKLRKPLHWDQRHHRDHQRGPRGPWAPLAASTKARYARMGKRRNRRVLARLPNARRTKVSARELVMTSPVKWSMAHQDGPSRVGHGARLPQRQFFWISKEFMREAKYQFELALYSRWKRMRTP